jgi:ribosome recycling factor
MTTIKGNFGGGPPQQEPIDISKTSEIKCEVCMNDTFEQSIMLRKLSAITSPTGQETIVPVQVFDCKKCGHVNSEFRQSDLDI